MTAQSLADEFADLLKDHSEVNSDDIAELYEIHHSIEAVIGLLFVQNATTVLTALRESGEAIERAAKVAENFTWCGQPLEKMTAERIAHKIRALKPEPSR